MEFYSTVIMLGSHSSHKMTNQEVLQVRSVNLLVGFVRLVGSLIGTSLLDKFGRRKLYISSTSILICCLFLLGLALDNEYLTVAKSCIVGFSFSISFGLSLINPVYLSELLPPQAISSLLVIKGMLAMLVTFLFPLIREISWIGTSGEMYFFGVATFACVLTMKYILVETKGMSIEEIKGLFEKEKSHEYNLEDEEEIAGLKKRERAGSQDEMMLGLRKIGTDDEGEGED